MFTAPHITSRRLGPMCDSFAQIIYAYTSSPLAKNAAREQTQSQSGFTVTDSPWVRDTGATIFKSLWRAIAVRNNNNFLLTRCCHVAISLRTGRIFIILILATISFSAEHIGVMWSWLTSGWRLPAEHLMDAFGLGGTTVGREVVTPPKHSLLHNKYLFPKYRILDTVLVHITQLAATNVYSVVAKPTWELVVSNTE